MRTLWKPAFLLLVDDQPIFIPLNMANADRGGEQLIK